MPAQDISRHLFDRRLRYAAALMQQGRVLTDADWNEMVRLADDDRRRAIAETVCTQGSPNDGFRVGTPVVAPATIHPIGVAAQAVQSYDFGIGAGSYYLGGYRFEHGVETPADRFLTQEDGLDFTLGGSAIPLAPTAAALGAGTRTDLVYLHGWHQAVTSVEDQEFRERALGGPDTSTRWRRTRRLEVLTGVNATNCAAARAVLQTQLARPRPGDTNGPHAFDADGTELRSKARLTVGFPGGSNDADACRPPALTGYIGAENQALRVQLTAANRFVWGIDNAAPLYRVQVDPTDATRKRILLLTLPRDQAAMPLAGQAVELLSWQAELANGEKAAAASGFLSTIATSYDPDTRSLVLQTALPQAWLDWLNTLPATVENPMDPAGQRRYFLMRLWSGGPDRAFVPGTAVTLPGTGLDLTFSDFGVAEDFWVIAARPFTPDLVVPWRLLDHAPPHGPQRLYAAVALITWRAGGGGVVATVHDCRERFRSLCRSNGCCQVIVGDGIDTFGDFSSIQAAIDALPIEGGEVCVLRGTYAEAIVIDGRPDIVVHGCGPDTRLVPPAGAAAGVRVNDSTGVLLRDFALVAPSMPGVLVTGASSQVTLRGLHVDARETCAILANVEQDLVIENCTLNALPLAAPLAPGGTVGLDPLLFVGGHELRIEGNRLDATAAPNDRVRPAGGLQIAGGSSSVEVRRNVIVNGTGVGITLGSLSYAAAAAAAAAPWPFGVAAPAPAPTPLLWIFDANGCISTPANPGTPTDPNGNPLVPVSDGDILLLRIVDNEVRAMGRSAIAAVTLIITGKVPDLITISDLRIESNRLVGCMRIEAATIADADLLTTAFGGIVLSDVGLARIDDNLIEEIGIDFHDPICGIFALQAEGISITGNRLRRNGRVAEAVAVSKPGLRGGIMLRFVRTPTEPLALKFIGGAIQGQRQDGTPAAAIHGNVVVAREGRALHVVALGAVTVTDNQFTAHGSDFLALLRQLISALLGVPLTTGVTGAAAGLAPGRNTMDLLLDSLGANAVLVFDVGWSNEVYLQLLGLDGKSGTVPKGGGAASWLIGGQVLFNDNQVTFDALDPVFTLSLCSTLLVSFDHVTMSHNQIACDLAVDFVLFDALVLGFAVQAQGNRLTEGLFNTLLSAVTFGVMNSTAMNVSTHCIADIALLPEWKPHAVAKPAGTTVHLVLNVALWDAFGTNKLCQTLKDLFDSKAPRLKFKANDVAFATMG